MKYNFDENIDRKNSYCMKYDMIDDVYPNAPKDSIPMWIADADFKCPQPIISAIKSACDENSLFGYSFNLHQAYFDSVISYFKRHFDFDIKKEHIFFSEGIVPALHNLVRCLTRPYEGVLVNTPAYCHFEETALWNDRELVKNPLIYNGDGSYDFDFYGFEKLCKLDNTKVFIFCNPHNPTGKVFSKDELLKIGNICKDNNVKIISDEIHCDLTRNGVRHIPIASLFENDDFIFTCTSPSKTFNMAGLHISNIIIKDKTVSDFWTLRQLGGHPNPLSIYAMISALTECDDWLDELKSYLDQNFDFLDKFLKENLPKAKFKTPQGTYLAWIDLNDYNLTTEEIMDKTKQNGVLIQVENSFVDNATGFIRMNLATNKERLHEALNRLVKALN